MQKPALRPYASDSALQQPLKRIIGHSISEPILTRKHPLLDETDEKVPHAYYEYLFAAETLENIVNEGAFVGTIRSEKSRRGGREMSDRVLKLVYDLPFIDTILVKTQFLVFNNQFLDSLGLVKVMLYDLIKYHFDYKDFVGVSFQIPADCKKEDEGYEQNCVDVVRDLDETLRQFQVKLSAAYARLRIERQASGDNFREQMENILPQDVKEKEEIAIDMPKTLRINSIKTTKKEVSAKLQQLGYQVVLAKYADLTEDQQDNVEHLLYLDNDFDDLLVIPSAFFADVKNSALVTQGLLIFQDKASLYCGEQLKTYIKKGDCVIDGRAGCGTKLAKLSELVGKTGKIYAFENRPGRLETLKSHIKLYGCDNVIVIEDDFSTCNVNDEEFKNVSTVIVEPMNSGTTIVDKLGFMLQEEEYPVDIVTIKDLLVLKRQQVTMLKHAFKFPKVQHILYQTRSTHAEENEQVVIETLDRWGVEWKLNCVLPDIPVDNEKENEIEECLTIDPSTGKGNGIFIAHFQLKPPKVEPERHRVHTQHTEHMTVGELEEQVEQVMKPKRKKKERKRGELLKFKLPKQLRSSVNRLSVPRLSTIDQKHEIIVKKDHKKEKVPIAVSEKVAAVPVVLERTPSQQAEFDMAVFGLSLSKFYGPRADALKQLQLKKMIANKPSWIYPVPNPTKWK